jgi:hypothetical protein
MVEVSGGHAMESIKMFVLKNGTSRQIPSPQRAILRIMFSDNIF